MAQEPQRSGDTMKLKLRGLAIPFVLMGWSATAVIHRMDMASDARQVKTIVKENRGACHSDSLLLDTNDLRCMV